MKMVGNLENFGHQARRSIMQENIEDLEQLMVYVLREHGRDVCNNKSVEFFVFACNHKKWLAASHFYHRHITYFFGMREYTPAAFLDMTIPSAGCYSHQVAKWLITNLILDGYIIIKMLRVMFANNDKIAINMLSRRYNIWAVAHPEQNAASFIYHKDDNICRWKWEDDFHEMHESPRDARYVSWMHKSIIDDVVAREQVTDKIQQLITQGARKSNDVPYEGNADDIAKADVMRKKLYAIACDVAAERAIQYVAKWAALRGTQDEDEEARAFVRVFQEFDWIRTLAD